MEDVLDKNVYLKERYLRFLVGAVGIAGVLMDWMPAWIAIAAVYPLCTAIVEWDPLYGLVSFFQRKRPASAHHDVFRLISRPPTTQFHL